jgi:hypothetical protein
MREAYNRWMEQHGGAIVNIIADIWNGWPDFAHSGAARGGMLTLTESAACEWAASGVRVNTVAPGGAASGGFDTYSPVAKGKILEFPKTVPMRRFGTESEISAAIVYLLSPAAAYITGSCMRVDGGAPNARNSWKLEEHARSPAFGANEGWCDDGHDEQSHGAGAAELRRQSHEHHRRRNRVGHPMSRAWKRAIASKLISRLAEPDWFYSRYSEKVGFEVSMDSVRYYQALSLLKLAATHIAAARCFEEGRFNDMRMPAMGSQIATALRQMEKTIEAKS